MNCIVVDDEHLALKIIEDWVSNIPFLKLVGSFRSTLKALEFLQQNTVDLLFLDINVPALSGTQLARLLTDDQMVIFTTAYPQFAVESYEINAVDYLMKPIEFDRFLKAANRAYEKYQLISRKQDISINNSAKIQNSKDEFVFIKSGTEIHQIKTNDILYIESAGNYVFFHNESLKDKKIMSLLSMNKVLEMLPQKQFYRIHKSYIINIQHIKLIERHQVQIKDIYLPIGKVYRESFFNIIEK